MAPPRNPKIQLAAGLYDRLVTEELRSAVGELDGHAAAHLEPLSPERGPHVLARHLAEVAERLLAALNRREGTSDLVQLAAAGRAALAALDAHVSQADQRPEE